MPCQGHFYKTATLFAASDEEYWRCERLSTDEVNRRGFEGNHHGDARRETHFFEGLLGDQRNHLRAAGNLHPILCLQPRGVLNHTFQPIPGTLARTVIPGLP